MRILSLILLISLQIFNCNGVQLVTIRNTNKNYCLQEYPDCCAYNDLNGAFWAELPCDALLSSQIFEYDSTAKTFKVQSSGKCMSVGTANYNGVSYDGVTLTGNQNEIGQRPVPADCNATNVYQQWTLDSQGHIINDKTTWCLDIHDYHYTRDYEKARVDGAVCSGGINQFWQLVEPTAAPTQNPTFPSISPTTVPSSSPTILTTSPTAPPSLSPTIPTINPTSSPTWQAVECGMGLTIPGPVCDWGFNGQFTTFGAFDMTSHMDISFNVSLKRGEFGSTELFRFENTAGRVPLKLISGASGGPHTRVILNDATGTETTIQCGVYGGGAYRIQIDARTVTVSHNGAICAGPVTLSNDLLESNLINTAFTVYGGSFSAGPCTHIVISTECPSTSSPTSSPTYSDCLSSGIDTNLNIPAGSAIYSPDGNVRFNVQDDGNLCLYTYESNSWIERFCTMTVVGVGGNDYYLSIQFDGNMVLYDGSDTIQWSTNTLSDASPITLCIDDCGYAYLTDVYNNELWHSEYNGNIGVGNYPTCPPPTPPPTASPTTPIICTKGVNYEISGQPCIAHGDPHFTTWNGAIHDFMGQFDSDQFYYVTPCDGYSKNDMPFNILATHKKWGARDVTGIDYLTFELYDDNGDEYLWFISASVNAYINKANAVDTIYDNNIANVITLNNLDTIGNIFKVQFTETTNRIDVTLTIDSECSVVFYMEGQVYFHGRWKMHKVVITPPECYRCFMCGLCGDFKHQKSISAVQTMETCHGGLVEFKAGWVAQSNPFAWDINGNTWQKSYVDAHCPRSTRRRLEMSTVYVPNINDFVYIDPCDATIKENVVTACQTARDNAQTCCNLIGNELCDNLQENCQFDACVASDGNGSLIADYVEQFLTEIIELLCTLPNSDHLFDPANLLEDDIQTETTTQITTVIISDNTREGNNAQGISIVLSVVVVAILAFC